MYGSRLLCTLSNEMGGFDILLFSIEVEIQKQFYLYCILIFVTVFSKESSDCQKWFYWWSSVVEIIAFIYFIFIDYWFIVLWLNWYILMRVGLSLSHFFPHPPPFLVYYLLLLSYTLLNNHSHTHTLFSLAFFFSLQKGEIFDSFTHPFGCFMSLLLK